MTEGNEEELQPGETLGEFRILERIGPGSLGNVYLAERIASGERVAIKTSPASDKKPAGVNPFSEAFRLLRKINHPNLAKIIEIGTEAGWHYLVVQHVGGPFLPQHTHGMTAPMNWRVVMGWIHDVSRALEALHAQLVIHCDVNPHNVMWIENRAVLVAFDLVQDISGPDEVSHDGSIRGTPAYMSPEQMREEPLDCRTDIYSLGTMAYTLLAGRVPFPGDTLMQMWMKKTRRELPDRIELLRPDLPREVAATITKAMAPDRIDRFPNSSSLIETLDRLLNPPTKEASAMETIRFFCQYCHQTLQIPRESRVKAVDCPTCGRSLTVPPKDELETIVGDSFAARITSCAGCGASLADATGTTQCKACDKTRDQPPADSSLSLQSEQAVNQQDALRVESLLKKIAAQSHFEERYDLQERLAAGGMGEVFRAFDHVLRREVAIKMMLPSVDPSHSSLAVRSQFLKEARIGGRLLHPNVLSVFDLGVNRKGQTYYTMRLVDGASLQHCVEALERGAVTRLIAYPLKKLVEVFVRACQGIDFAHVNGVWHLDLKPQNILVSGFNEVFVIDWGLAKVDQEDDTDDLIDLYQDSGEGSDTVSNTMAFGRVIGTPGYMAPEQARGAVRSFTTATDVYGLGGILYYILYGRAPNSHPKQHDFVQAATAPKKKGKLRSGILPRGQRIRQEVIAAVQALETICLKCLEIDPMDRYPTAEQLIVDLNEWLSLHAIPNLSE